VFAHGIDNGMCLSDLSSSTLDKQAALCVIYTHQKGRGNSAWGDITLGHAGQVEYIPSSCR